MILALLRVNEQFSSGCCVFTLFFLLYDILRFGKYALYGFLRLALFKEREIYGRREGFNIIFKEKEVFFRRFMIDSVSFFHVRFRQEGIC